MQCAHNKRPSTGRLKAKSGSLSTLSWRILNFQYPLKGSTFTTVTRVVDATADGKSKGKRHTTRLRWLCFHRWGWNKWRFRKCLPSLLRLTLPSLNLFCTLSASYGGAQHLGAPKNAKELFFSEPPKRGRNLVARAIRNAIRANRFARIIRNRNPYFYSASGRFAGITRISDSRESPDSHESCESIRANHATKGRKTGAARKLSKSVENIFDTDFWRFFALCEKMSKSVEKLLDNFWRFLTFFWRGPFPLAPFAIRWSLCPRERSCGDRDGGVFKSPEIGGGGGCSNLRKLEGGGGERLRMVRVPEIPWRR